jgi:hypothetical protein
MLGSQGTCRTMNAAIEARRWETAKHYAAVLRAYYRWNSRFMFRDGPSWGVCYLGRDGVTRTLGANALELWGRAIEARIARRAAA